MKTTPKARRTAKKAPKKKKQSNPRKSKILQASSEVEAYPIEKGVERTSGKHSGDVLRILKSMLDCKEVDDSFFIKTDDAGKARSLRGSVSHIARKYSEFKKMYFTTMLIYRKGNLEGLRVFRDH